MKLITFSDQLGARIGVLQSHQIVDLSQAAPELPTDMLALLTQGDQAIDSSQ